MKQTIYYMLKSWHKIILIDLPLKQTALAGSILADMTGTALPIEAVDNGDIYGPFKTVNYAIESSGSTAEATSFFSIDPESGQITLRKDIALWEGDRPIEVISKL